MKKEIINRGRKLNKKELNTIQGGRRICIPPGTSECAYYGKFCGEPECQVPPILN